MDTHPPEPPDGHDFPGFGDHDGGEYGLPGDSGGPDDVGGHDHGAPDPLAHPGGPDTSDDGSDEPPEDTVTTVNLDDVPGRGPDHAVDSGGPDSGDTDGPDTGDSTPDAPGGWDHTEASDGWDDHTGGNAAADLPGDHLDVEAPHHGGLDGDAGVPEDHGTPGFPDAVGDHVPGAHDPVTDLTAAFGADPDLPGWDDDGDDAVDQGDWLNLPDLTDVDVPEPAGGRPWVDVALLGDPSSGDPGPPPDLADGGDAVHDGAVEFTADLRAALGEPDTAPAGEDSYTALLGSDDPAVRSLARLWGPPT
jgi:hypothetical protein